MKLSTNLIRFHQEFGLKRTIDIFSAAGFDRIDFNTDLEEYHTDAHGPDFYRQIRAYAEDRGIVIHQAHAPFRSNFPDEAKTEQRFFEIARSMEHAALLGAKMIVVHPCSHFTDAQMRDPDFAAAYNYRFYRRLLPYAEACGIRIAIENIHNYLTADAEGLIALLDALNSDAFTVCFDAGHARLAGQDPAEMIRTLGGRIGCTHIHDNDGISDLHTLPYYGVIDWESVMQAFADTGYDGSLNYEASRFFLGVPRELLPDGAKYMASVGRHLIERFRCRKQTL